MGDLKDLLSETMEKNELADLLELVVSSCLKVLKNCNQKEPEHLKKFLYMLQGAQPKAENTSSFLQSPAKNALFNCVPSKKLCDTIRDECCVSTLETTCSFSPQMLFPVKYQVSKKYGNKNKSKNANFDFSAFDYISDSSSIKHTTNLNTATDNFAEEIDNADNFVAEIENNLFTELNIAKDIEITNEKETTKHFSDNFAQEIDNNLSTESNIAYDIEITNVDNYTKSNIKEQILSDKINTSLVEPDTTDDKTKNTCKKFEITKSNIIILPSEIDNSFDVELNMPSPIKYVPNPPTPPKRLKRQCSKIPINDTSPTTKKRSSDRTQNKLKWVKSCYVDDKKDEEHIHYRRKNKKFEEWETELLLEAVTAIGVGHWAEIKKSYKFPAYRTALDLKDKWRNIQKHKW